MSDTDEKQLALLDQQVALSAYFGSLLEAPAQAEPRPPSTSEAALLTPSPASPASPATRMAAPLKSEVALLEPITRVTITSPATPAVAAVADVQKPSTRAASGVPEWGQKPFQSLLFQVGGLTLAVPLAKLSGVMPLDFTRVTPMPGHSHLFLGLIDHHGHKVSIIDAAQVVLPPERLRNQSGEFASRLSHLVLVGEGGWGLACSGIGKVISLGTEDVKWRSGTGKRPWLAGTVIQHMCALVDVEAMITLFESGAAP